MNNELLFIVDNLQTTIKGKPWYGRSVYEILDEINESKVTIKPNAQSHSLLELLWHMTTWAEFTLAVLEQKSATDLSSIESKDWRPNDPVLYPWQNGLIELKSFHQRILQLLSEKNDGFLNDISSHHKYTIRFILHGLIHHNIYHAGQMAYLNKLLASNY